ncbi:hypothetical protein niasHT_005151 [Heterodera trifolii]|uniref:Acyltransferase 3 domain-containing protein n=1 Tax=Heterodera trifolii TaxID=157864 RepID=A0ABD2LRN7_9BILA
MLLGLAAAFDDHFQHFPWLFSALFGWLLLLFLLLALFPSFSANLSLQLVSPRRALIALFRAPNPTEHYLAFLDIFRIGAICWVISNHLGSEGRLDSVHSLPIFGPILGNSALGVEVFLVLSGFLAARSWHRRWQSDLGFWPNSLNFLLHRWLRLAPTTMAFVFLAAEMSRLAFPLFHQTIAANCTGAQFFSFALLLNNWNRPNCFGYLWHFGLDWQCHLIAPFLLHLLFRRQSVGLNVVAVLVIGSMCLRAFKCVSNGICNKSDVDIPFVSVRPEHVSLVQMYMRPMTKCGPFLVGLLLGVFSLSLTVSSPPKWAEKLKTQQKKLFCAGFCLAVGCVYGILPEYWYPNDGVTLYNTLYTASFRTLFACGIGLMMLSCLLSTKSSFRPRLIHRIFAVFARLTFSVALTHMPIVFLFTRITAFQETESPFSLIIALPPAILMSFTVATIFYCFIHWPISQIISRIIK